MSYSAPGVRGLVISTMVAWQIACSSDSVITDANRRVPLLPQVSQLGPPPITPEPTLDELFVSISRQVPSFAGIYIDTDGDVVVQVTDSVQADAARSEVLRVFGSAPTIRGRPLRTRIVRYTFSQLQTWLGRLLESGVPAGVRTTDIDERANAVRIGIADAATLEILQARARTAAIPADALNASTIPPIIQQTDYLGSRVRPVMGGLSIVTSYAGCSLGFKAKSGSVRYVVTNAHCTTTLGADDNNDLGQPLLQSSYFIGTEYSDPAFVSGGSCQSGHYCRYGDAALFQCDTLSHCTNYTIARTTSEYTGSDWNQSGSFELTAEPWYVVGELSNSSLTQGLSVSKVGANSGWTGGTIDQTCFAVYNAGGQNKDLLCQYSATYVSRLGDSGSPVFTYDATQGKAWLAGIHHSAGGGYSTFSPISGVKTDLGSITVSSPVF